MKTQINDTIQTNGTSRKNEAPQENNILHILVLADHKSKLLYDYYDPERVKDIDLII